MWNFDYIRFTDATRKKKKIVVICGRQKQFAKYLANKIFLFGKTKPLINLTNFLAGHNNKIIFLLPAENFFRVHKFVSLILINRIMNSKWLECSFIVWKNRNSLDYYIGLFISMAINLFASNWWWHTLRYNIETRRDARKLCGISRDDAEKRSLAVSVSRRGKVENPTFFLSRRVCNVSARILRRDPQFCCTTAL